MRDACWESGAPWAMTLRAISSIREAGTPGLIAAIVASIASRQTFSPSVIGFGVSPTVTVRIIAAWYRL